MFFHCPISHLEKSHSYLPAGHTIAQTEIDLHCDRKDPLLKSFLEHGKEVCESILKSLDDSHLGRITEIKEELSDISFALKYMDE